MASRLASPTSLTGATASGSGSGFGHMAGDGGGAGGGYTGYAPAANTAVTKEQIEELVRIIWSTPMIDNHAHPLLKPESQSRYPLMSIISEASGDAIHAASKTLAHQRAVKQLAAVLGCVSTWEAVVAGIEQRRIESHNEWVAQCLEGVETILVDDGLDDPEHVQDLSWHGDFVRSPCKRIVRIEAVAAEIIDRHAKAYGPSSAQSTDGLFDVILEEFDTKIKQGIEDPDVVGFKSVICYRTGLGIPKVVDVAAARDSFSDIIESYDVMAGDVGFTKLNHVALNELFVHHTAVLIRDCSSRFRKPIQFHTGLGDNDITLAKSSPSLLQEFIRAYPSVPIVLLHASYPFSREAAYLASVYTNVYVDIGEVFPLVSQEGQETILRQLLELCPWSKMLWSSDGHWFPETYLLAGIQGREALEAVLCEYVRKGVIGWKAAIGLTWDVLFRNSNQLYKLELTLSQLPHSGNIESHLRSTGHKPASSTSSSTTHPEHTDLEILDRFLASKPLPSFVRICWVDYTSIPRMRVIPFKKFLFTLEAGVSPDIGIPKATMGLLQNDTLAPGVTATGEYRLHPDFSSIKSGPMSGHISMYGEFREKDGSRVALCPRTQLVRAISIAGRHKLQFLVGFEVEFLLLQRASGLAPKYSKLVNDGHAWSSSRCFADPQVARLLRDIVLHLEATGIDVEQVHAESAPGQFELSLPPLPPLEAVDTLLHVRETIAALATAAGYKFSLHPKPFDRACGTASHVHLSISSQGGDSPEVYESFYAGIMSHLPALLAFTCSSPVSYDRMADSCWAGGRWVAWGTQNRETPLRKIDGSHWELKCMDGMANPYLAMAALLLCGCNGLRKRETLSGRWGDCEVDPSVLTDNDRKELGITRMLPASLGEALVALQEDDELGNMLSFDLVERYAAVKGAEIKLLEPMGVESKWEWIVERY